MYVERAVARRGTVVVLPEDIDLIDETRIAEQLTLPSATAPRQSST
jgi:hypothetical protein